MHNRSQNKRSVLFSLTSAFVVIGRIAPDEERLILLKPVMQFYFTYGVSRGFQYIYLKPFLMHNLHKKKYEKSILNYISYFKKFNEHLTKTIIERQI